MACSFDRISSGSLRSDWRVPSTLRNFKVSIVCGTSSSVTSKSAILRSATGSSPRCMTVTSTRTRSVPALKIGCWGGGSAGAGFCSWAATAAVSNRTRTSRIFASYTDRRMSRPKQWDVLGVGCNSVDHVYRLPASPTADSPTAKLRISNHSSMCGGQMATAMAACAGFGLKTAYVGCVGHDHSGRLLRAELEQRGVDISLVKTRECTNRFAVITVDETTGERIVLWDRDERLNLASREIEALPIAAARIVHVDDEDQEAAIAAATIARRAGVPCA